MMFWTDKRQKVKTLLVVSAVLIAAASLVFSHKLTTALYHEEVAKMEVWAEAMRSLTASDEQTDLNLVLKIIGSNHTIPVVVVDSHGAISTSRNLSPEPSGPDSLAQLQRQVDEMKEHGLCITMDLAPIQTAPEVHDYLYVYYEESVLLRRLRLYPYVQLAVVGVFVLIALYALLASKKAEQNRVWVGLSRETAHQLGTPISSLMAWSQVLCETYPNDPLLPEMDKDVERLQLIAERFSKIGSAPELRSENLCEVVKHVVEYFDHRTSRKVHFEYHAPAEPLIAAVNAPLFEWVIENLCKNAVDAMEGVGTIIVSMSHGMHGVHIEVSDTGKGIARKHFKGVFRPGYTTKKRGWGLGLSLAKRIVEEYHHGKIYVQSSIIGQGTTFGIDIG